MTATATFDSFNRGQSVTSPLTYHADGSRTFEWDAADPLVAINYNGTSDRSEFTYKGLSRRVKSVEKTGGTVISEQRLVWNGLSIAEQRDAANAVTKRFYDGGVQTIGACRTRRITPAAARKASRRIRQRGGVFRDSGGGRCRRFGGRPGKTGRSCRSRLRRRLRRECAGGARGRGPRSGRGAGCCGSG